MSDETFLSRWARLKTPPQDTPSAESVVEPISKPTVAQANPVNPPALSSDPQEIEPVEQPPLTDEDMPAIESLGDNSDFSQFFSSGVSEELRNLALRKLFNLPQFNIRDGLNDYDDDFSKMPALSQEVVARMRSWLHDKQEEATADISEQLHQTVSTEQTEVNNTVDETDSEDEMGDADLQG